MTESDAYFILNLLSGIGPVRAKRLRERFGSLDVALTARGADLRSVEGIGPEMVEKLVSWKETVDFEKERKWAEELGLTIVTMADATYPASLSEIYDPPMVLYIKGKVPETWPRGVAVVGSRETSHYGLENAKKLGYQLAYAGVPVISGLARAASIRRRISAHSGRRARLGPCSAAGSTRCIRRKTTRSPRRSSSRAAA
jgi:DNA processing protein